MGNVMKTLRICIFVCMSLLYFTGCSVTNNFFGTKTTTQEYNNVEEYNKAIYNATNQTNIQKDFSVITIENQLLQQYQEWKNTKYKYGGTTKNGVDCSAFVQNTFQSKFNIRLPRTTKLQVNVGEEIEIEDLKTGDLVFFKTGYNQRHVGIYLSNGDFLHASTKNGVTISNLNNPYYSRNFWTAKRINF